MITLRAELHVHTVLSPCGDVEMIPPLIVQEALDQGIGLLAITDHNASDNIWAVQKAAKDTGLVVLPGMEVQTREEVHSLCLFDTLDQVEAWQDEVDRALPAMKNNPEYFGEQFVVDETGEFIRRDHRLLLNSVELSLNEAFKKVTALGGLFIPAHVNRKAFGLLANLGLVPTDIALEALEISRHITPEDARRTYPQLQKYPLIQSGDVHYLADFLGKNEITIEKATITELRLALQQRDGRSLRIA